MIDLTGSPLDEARRIIEENGIALESVEKAVTPPGAGHPPTPGTPLIEYVATQWTTPTGALRLRVVSAPELKF